MKKHLLDKTDKRITVNQVNIASNQGDFASLPCDTLIRPAMLES